MTGRPKIETPPIPAAGSRLTVLKKLGTVGATKTSGGKHVYKCRCECGQYVVTLRHRIVSGNCKSCGCLRREVAKSKIEFARSVYVKQRRLVNAQ